MWTCIKGIGCTTRLLMLGRTTCVDVWWDGMVVCEGVDGMQPGTENVLGVDDKKSPHGEVPKCIWARSRAPPLSSLFNFSSSCYTLPCPTRETLHVNHLVLLVHWKNLQQIQISRERSARWSGEYDMLSKTKTKRKLSISLSDQQVSQLSGLVWSLASSKHTTKLFLM